MLRSLIPTSLSFYPQLLLSFLRLTLRFASTTSSYTPDQVDLVTSK